VIIVDNSLASFLLILLIFEIKRITRSGNILIVPAILAIFFTVHGKESSCRVGFVEDFLFKS
jgi:hypothetical protein